MEVLDYNTSLVIYKGCVNNREVNALSIVFNQVILGTTKWKL